MNGDKNKPDFKVPNLERALIILEHLVQLDGELTQSEISLGLNFPNSSVLRILNALEYYGYIIRNELTKKYQSATNYPQWGATPRTVKR